MSDVAAKPIPLASTLLLLRQGAEGVEVLMITRHADLVFSGALAFPGGRVDPEDSDAAVQARCCNSEATARITPAAGVT